MSPSVEFLHVSKRYRVGQWLPSLREALASRGARDPSQYHWAVKDVSFSLEPGEALGIIGPNGAGKTTILKLLSRVTYPTQGEIQIHGRLSALIELGAGFHPDLTGRENIYLNGTILGMKRAEIRRRFDQIVEFAGIGHYLDTPVKRYSSGMYARLGFAIAAHMDPDVLLVDEVLAVGDYAFQQKCHAHMDRLRSQGTTLIFVSHNMEAVRRVCDKVLVMYRGEKIFEGSAAEGVIAYSDALREAARNRSVEVPEEGGLAERIMTFDAEIVRVELLDETGQPTTVLQAGQRAIVRVHVVFHRDVSSPIFSLIVRTVDGRTVYDTTTKWQGIETPHFRAGERCTAVFELDICLLDGEYQLGVDTVATDFSHYYDRLERAMNFYVEGARGAQGLADLRARFSVNRIMSSEEIP